MTRDAYVTPKDAEDFIRANPTVRWIDLVLFDLNGLARGKRIQPNELKDVANKGFMVPLSMYIIDPRGNCIEETGRLWETGDPDIVFKMLAGTLSVIPVNGSTHAQAVVVPVEDDGGLDPRGVLARQQALFENEGLTPVAAVELEFYVMKRGANGAFALQPPDGITDNPDWPKLYQFEELDLLGPFVDDIYRIAKAQNLPLGAVLQESGPSQFEINLEHRTDVSKAAVEGLLLKRAVKAAARNHGLDATFMAKPHHDWSGSGMHIHMSLVDKAGKNVFAGDPFSDMFRHGLGGLQQTMPEFTAIWAQSANAYRRYVPKAYVAMQANWGFNNRNVALRIPRGQSPSATRVEHRVSAADANPFLVIAAILAGLRHGITNKIEPGKMAEGAADGTGAPLLPTAWINALDMFAKSEVAKNAFGETFHHVFYKLKDTERADFERTVTSLDHLWYAQVN